MFEINSCCYPGLETKVFSRDWYTAWPLVVNHIRLIPFIKTRQLLPSFNQVQTRHHQTGNLSKHLSCIERDRAPRNLKEISNQAQALFASRKWTWQFQKKKNFFWIRFTVWVSIANAYIMVDYWAAMLDQAQIKCFKFKCILFFCVCVVIVLKPLVTVN